MNYFQEYAINRLKKLFSKFHECRVYEHFSKLSDNSEVIDYNILPANIKYFPVKIVIFEDNLQLYFGDFWHEYLAGGHKEHYTPSDSENISNLEYCLELLENLFSGKGCIEEKRSNGKPYIYKFYTTDKKGILICRGANQKAILFNWFGKRDIIKRYAAHYYKNYPE